MILGCKGLADCHCGLHSLEVPVSSGTRLHHSACKITIHFDSQLGRFKARDWCEVGFLSLGTAGIFHADAGATSLHGNVEVSSDANGLCVDTEGVVFYIDLPCSPCKTSAEVACKKSHQQFLAVGQKGGVAAPVLSRRSHEQIKMTSRAEVSQISESKIPSNLGTHVLRALLETDHVQRFQRWRQVAPIEQGQGSVLHMQEKPETVPSLKMSTSPVKEGLEEHAPVRGEKVGLAEHDLLKDLDDHRISGQGDLPCSNLEKMETKVILNLGTHALRALMDADDVQKFKRRRVTTPTDAAGVKNLKEISDNPPDSLSRESDGLSVLREGDVIQESFVRPDLGGMPAPRSSTLIGNAQDTVATDLPAFGDNNSRKSWSGGIKGNSDTLSDSSSGSPSHSVDRETPDMPISRPSRYSGGVPTDVHGPRKKEWLGQHHGGKMDTGIAQDAEFAGNVGGCYRSSIDKRPAAPHPGFVGDGAMVQYCRVCSEREDATTSLICDSCEEVFHMTCVNARMKLVPRVDEWLCRPCKKKRKMIRDSEHQVDSDPGGEPKDWWREDSGIGKVERELVRMSNGRRMKVRIGPKFQADVPEWTGIIDDVDLDDTLAETSDRFGEEVPSTSEEKQREQQQAEYNLANKIWPRGWLPATQLPPGSKENWIQCMLVLFDEGEICPNGQKAEKDIICGKWRRTPADLVTDDEWECSCALEWDPRHADCAVPQELSTEEIIERTKFSKINVQQETV